MKPRVVILSAFLSPFRSGAEACAEEVPKALREIYDFTIITARLRKDLPAQEVWNGNIKVVRVGSGNFFWDKWLYPFRAAREASRHDPEIIHAVLETFAGYALMKCRRTCPKAKRILTCQTTNRSLLKGPIVRSADKVTVISAHLKNIVEMLRRKDDVDVIPNGIDFDRIRNACKEFKKVPNRILFVGRLEEMKGVDTLLAAIQKLRIKNGKLKMDVRIVGDGSQRQSLEAQSRNLGLTDCVTFTGYIAAPDVYKEFAEAEIFCGLSRSEALGNVFIEAQAAECAVVATTVGGIPEMVNDEISGILVPPNNPDEASMAIERILNDADLQKKLATGGTDYVRLFYWYAIAQKYNDVYAQLLR